MLTIQIPVSEEITFLPKTRPRVNPLLKDRSEWKAIIYDLWEEKEKSDLIYDDLLYKLKKLRKNVYHISRSKYAAEAKVILYGICVLEKMGMGMKHVKLMMMLSDIDDM